MHPTVTGIAASYVSTYEYGRRGHQPDPSTHEFLRNFLKRFAIFALVLGSSALRSIFFSRSFAFGDFANSSTRFMSFAIRVSFLRRRRFEPASRPPTCMYDAPAMSHPLDT